MPLHKIPLCKIKYVGDTPCNSGTFKYDTTSTVTIKKNKYFNLKSNPIEITIVGSKSLQNTNINNVSVSNNSKMFYKDKVTINTFKDSNMSYRQYTNNINVVFDNNLSTKKIGNIFINKNKELSYNENLNSLDVSISKSKELALCRFININLALTTNSLKLYRKFNLYSHMNTFLSRYNLKNINFHKNAFINYINYNKEIAIINSIKKLTRLKKINFCYIPNDIYLDRIMVKDLTIINRVLKLDKIKNKQLNIIDVSKFIIRNNHNKELSILNNSMLLNKYIFKDMYLNNNINYYYKYKINDINIIKLFKNLKVLKNNELSVVLNTINFYRYTLKNISNFDNKKYLKNINKKEISTLNHDEYFSNINNKMNLFIPNTTILNKNFSINISKNNYNIYLNKLNVNYIFKSKKLCLTRFKLNILSMMQNSTFLSKDIFKSLCISTIKQLINCTIKGLNIKNTRYLNSQVFKNISLSKSLMLYKFKNKAAFITTSKNLNKILGNSINKTNDIYLGRHNNNRILKNKLIKYYYKNKVQLINLSAVQELYKIANFPMIISSFLMLHKNSTNNLSILNTSKFYYKYRIRCLNILNTIKYLNKNAIKPTTISNSKYLFKHSISPIWIENVKYLKDLSIIDVYLNFSKYLGQGQPREIYYNNSSIYLGIYKRWWWLSPTGPYDNLIIPNKDFNYGQDLLNNPDYQYLRFSDFPISWGTNWGIDWDIPPKAISVEIMIDIINIIGMIWHHDVQAWLNCTGKESMQFLMEMLYEWYTLETSKPTEDYYRVFRWIRWEAEKVYFKEYKNGLQAIGVLIANLIDYMKRHHFNLVPIWSNLKCMDIERNFNKKATNGDLTKNLDKLKGKRHYLIDTQNYNKKNILGGNK